MDYFLEKYFNKIKKLKEFINIPANKRLGLNGFT